MHLRGMGTIVAASGASVYRDPVFEHLDAPDAGLTFSERLQVCSHGIRRDAGEMMQGCEIGVAVRREEAASAGHGSGFASHKSLVAKAASSVSA